MSSQLQTFLLKNNLMDSNLQKAYISGINGCNEHCTAPHSSPVHAQAKNSPLALGSVDLINAFGSLSHKLTLYTLQCNQFSASVQQYINSLYSNFSAIHVLSFHQTSPLNISLCPMGSSKETHLVNNISTELSLLYYGPQRLMNNTTELFSTIHLND